MDERDSKERPKTNGAAKSEKKGTRVAIEEQARFATTDSGTSQCQMGVDPLRGLINPGRRR